MSTYRVEGIVIKRTDFSEADRILTIFTKDRGKVSALAKGVKRITSRKGGHVELLNHSLFFIAEGKSLDIITEAETIDPFNNIKGDLEKAGFGYYMAEFINEFLQEGQISYSLFRLFLMALSFLNDVDAGRESLLVRAFEIKALGELGFAPEIRFCTLCGEPLTWGVRNGFSPEAGGVLCAACAVEQGFSMERRTLDLLRVIMGSSWRRLGRLDTRRLPLADVQSLMQSYIEYILEKRLKSTELIEKIRSGNFTIALG